MFWEFLYLYQRRYSYYMLMYWEFLYFYQRRYSYYMLMYWEFLYLYQRRYSFYILLYWEFLYLHQRERQFLYANVLRHRQPYSHQLYIENFTTNTDVLHNFTSLLSNVSVSPTSTINWQSSLLKCYTYILYSVHTYCTQVCQ